MVIWDASLMQRMEVAYEIKDHTDVVVGSEESPPGEGYVYDRFLSDLAANPNLSPAQFGTSIVTRTLQAYGRNNNRAQSALDVAATIPQLSILLQTPLHASPADWVFARATLAGHKSLARFYSD